MAAVETNNFSSPDEVRRPPRTTVEVVKLAGGEIGRYTFEPGWRWAECISMSRTVPPRSTSSIAAGLTQRI